MRACVRACAIACCVQRVGRESAAVGVVVFDVTNRATFESCGKWVDEFRKLQREHSTAAHAANIPMLLLGTIQR